MTCLRFLHIPKTAGTSFYDCLERTYPGDHVFLKDNWRAAIAHHRDLDPEVRDRITLISGHAPRITGEPLIDSLPTVTFLRDPVQRAMSFCNHVWEGKSPHLRGRFPPGAFDLDEFLHSGDQQIENMQTRMLICPRCFKLPQLPRTALVRRAVEALTREIVCFGLVERMAESLTLFADALGWPGVPQLDRLNVHSPASRLTFTPAQVGRLWRLNSVDRDVYRAATAIFEERLRDRAFAAAAA